jgi:hypothetical protein
MLSKLPKILTILFILFVVLQISSFLFLNLFCLPAQAEAEWKIPDLQITIPGMKKFTTPGPCPDDPTKTCVPWIGQYIAGIYKYAIGIVGILATVVMMIGGIMWIVAGGNATRVGEAKAWIGASLTGLVLALTSYTILYQINPKLTQFKPIKVTTVEKRGCCEYYENTTQKAKYMSRKNCNNLALDDKYIVVDFNYDKIVSNDGKECMSTVEPTGCCTAKIKGVNSWAGCLESVKKLVCEKDRSSISGKGGLPSSFIGYDTIFLEDGKCNNNAWPAANPCYK